MCVKKKLHKNSVRRPVLTSVLLAAMLKGVACPCTA